MDTLSKRELDALVEEAIADAYDEYEQTSSFAVMIGENVDFPFKTVLLGTEVTVTGVDEVPGPGIAAVCRQGKERQRVGILDLPMPSPPPAGSEWIAAYRHRLTGA
ncbi:hypothetical protein [Catenulispora rubra]|uniref:hypothetical protein n=1 Tax=Catenulispora rubra TaxID=280293 RepID=UPI0018921EA5|nr:hypothetical protein [Catenulispora rubra]